MVERLKCIQRYKEKRDRAEIIDVTDNDRMTVLIQKSVGYNIKRSITPHGLCVDFVPSLEVSAQMATFGKVVIQPKCIQTFVPVPPGKRLITFYEKKGCYPEGDIEHATHLSISIPLEKESFQVD